MKKKTGIDPSYYENNCFAGEFREADRKGELLRPHDGKNAIEVMREHIAAKKSGNKPVRSILPLLGMQGTLDIPKGTTLTLDVEGINIRLKEKSRLVAAAAKAAIK